MMFNARYLIVALLMGFIVLSGCGRKEAPQPVTEHAITPQLTDLRHEAAGNVLQLHFKIHGDAAGVGYQVDRTEIDPYCQCPGFWRRYIEQPAIASQVDTEMVKFIKLKTTKVEYAFRVRAFDTAGNLGPWSKMIRARGVDLFNK
ncbi:MAG: hypothetical protein ACE5E3_00605 [Mariprofundus sp.]